jgi:protein-S-isoprenylcysteine O-methyltransferase Ste14
VNSGAFWPTIAVVGVIAAWILLILGILLLGFVLSRRGPRPKVARRDALSYYGLAIEAVAFALIWIIRRPFGDPLFPTPLLVQALVALITILLAAWSVGLVLSGVRTLDKQLNVGAKIVTGHDLIMTGPFAIVRNPMYSGVMTMLLATGLAFSRWWIIVPALVLFVCGTSLRIRSEEKLLRETFGDTFHDYARRVPALLPRLW